MKTNQEAHNQHEILSEDFEKIGKWIYIGIIWMMIILIMAIILVTVVFFGKSSTWLLSNFQLEPQKSEQSNTVWTVNDSELLQCNCWINCTTLLIFDQIDWFIVSLLWVT